MNLRLLISIQFQDYRMRPPIPIPIRSFNNGAPFFMQEGGKIHDASILRLPLIIKVIPRDALNALNNDII